MVFSKKEKRLIKRIRQDMRRAGVRLLMRKSLVVMCDGDPCSGYFDSDGKRVVVASTSDSVSFLAVLCHEYGHFMQWRDFSQGKRTARAQEWAVQATIPHMFGAKKRKTDYASYLALLNLEAGAEKVAEKMMRRWKIGTEEDRLAHVKAGALYLYCHKLMYEKRRWFKGSADLLDWLQDRALWDVLPTTLRGKDFSRLPRKLRPLLLKRF